MKPPPPPSSPPPTKNDHKKKMTLLVLIAHRTDEVNQFHTVRSCNKDKRAGGGILQARKFYESALHLEAGFLGAALASAELHVVEGRNKDVVSLLERYQKDLGLERYRLRR